MPMTLVPGAMSRIPRELAEPSFPRSPRVALDGTTPLDGAARDAAFAEREFVARLRHGDDAAYETLVRTHGPAMLAVARGYVSTQDDAEDVLQSAFLLVFRFIHRFEGASKLSTWLHRIVVNCALMRIRSRNRRPEARLDLSAFEDGSLLELPNRIRPSVADELVRGETRDGLMRAVGSLPDKVRAAVRLRDVDGLSLAEISRLLGRSLVGIKRDLARGRIALRRMLTRHGDPYGAGGPRVDSLEPCEAGTSR